MREIAILVNGSVMSIDGCKQFERTPRFSAGSVAALLWILSGPGALPVSAQEPARTADSDPAQVAATQERVPARPTWPLPKDAKRLVNDEATRAWVDPEQGVILIDGEVSLREGVLEMFACTRNTKEHESVVVVDTQAFPIHAALLALGAEPGGPVQFEPEFVPPSGTEIDVEVQWLDENEKLQQVRAQEWVRNVKTDKVLAHPWVFAGSLFYTDPDTGRRYYQAEGGDFVCVSNFGTAMLDLPIESTQANEGLYFEAFTERVPPLSTPVRLILKPVLQEPERNENASAQ
jgi:hypothetical protein